MKKKICCYLKRILSRLLKVVAKIEEGKNEKKIISPIIFMNTPIEDSSKDAIGVHASVSAIENAIHNGAKMIGVIAEYGAGKTSLTELLIRRRKKSKVIRINLWDTLAEIPHGEKSIKHLTKSFIYQLAMGKSQYRAEHVNKILNDNYGIIAFSTGHIRTRVYLGLAAIFQTLFLICDNLSLATFETLFPLLNGGWKYAINDFAPGAQLLAIAFVAFALLDASIAYSHWKNENKRVTDIGEVFSAYAYVHKCLRTCRLPYLVIIEDLDRIENREKVIEFLKELYRFNNLCRARYKKEPVFLIAIAPESRLKSQQENENEKIYSKIFDYTISLKPIHFDDYRTILQEILDSEPEKKEKLDEILSEDEKFIEGQISESFTWLYRGKNLTLRDLKERLNQAIELYIELKNKQYIGNESISFRVCVCVTYLETTYGKAFYDLIKDEKVFADIIQGAYKWQRDKNIKNIDDYEDKIKNIYDNDEITRDIAELVYRKVLDADYRMYFYSFPKGSYIKNVDEKDVCNYLEYPKDYSYEVNEVNEKISRLEKSDRLEKIHETLKRIAVSKDDLYYPKVILENEYLFKVAFKENYEKCLETLKLLINWGEKLLGNNRYYLNNVKKFLKNMDIALDKTRRFWEEYCESLYSFECAISDDKGIIEMRRVLIDVFKRDILWFKNLFMCSEEISVPLISMCEIQGINDIKISLELIDGDTINLNSYKSIIEVFQKPLEKELLEKATALHKTLLEKEDIYDVGDYVYQYVYVNGIVIDEFFTKLCELVEKDEFPVNDFIQYINGLDVEQLNDEHLKIINKMNLDASIDVKYIEKLKADNLYVLPLRYYNSIGKLDKIDFSENIEFIIKACEYIKSEQGDLIPKIRFEIIKQSNSNLIKDYKALFFDDYQLVTIQELRAIEDFKLAMYIIWGENLTIENVDEYIGFINEQVHVGDECYSVFMNLVDSENSGNTNPEIVSQIIYNLDYEKLKMMTISEEQRENVIGFLKTSMNLNTLDKIIGLMKSMKFMLPKYEEEIITKRGTASYIEFVNEMNMYTDYTIKHIISFEPSYGLNSNITKKLLEEGYLEHYAVGKILFDDIFVYPMSEVPSEVLRTLYFTKTPVYSYLAECACFIQNLMDESAYLEVDTPITEEVIRPFYRLKQSTKFMQFVIQNFDKKEILYYLETLNEIKSQEESVDIARLLMDNIAYLTNEDIYNHVKERLWENTENVRGYKAALTRKRAEFLKDSANK